ncbi:hypothetical protein ACJJTC_006638 [Scirpophaga incertulas]
MKKIAIQQIRFFCSRSYRRVVVTGLGIVSPLGTNTQTAWKNLLDGYCGIGSLNDAEYSKLPCKIAGVIQKDGESPLNAFLTKSNLKSMAPATCLALAATAEALSDANWVPVSDNDKESTGCCPRNGLVQLVHIQLEMHIDVIRNRDAEVMICGGAESCISPLAIAGFCRLRALSTAFNETPTKASRPFDKKRDGFVMGEGDASHITTPREDGSGAILSMSRALRDAGINKEAISYINAHATSTPVGAHGHLLGAAGNLEASFTALACYYGMLPPTLNLEEPVDNLKYVINTSLKWETEKRIALKNSFGFGGTNATLCIGQI